MDSLASHLTQTGSRIRFAASWRANQFGNLVNPFPPQYIMSAIPSNSLPFFVTVFFTASGNRLQITQFSDPHGRDAQLTIPRGIELPLEEMEAFLKNGPFVVNLKDDLTIPESLLEYPKQLGCETAAYVPILQEGRLRGLILLGARADQT